MEVLGDDPSVRRNCGSYGLSPRRTFPALVASVSLWFLVSGCSLSVEPMSDDDVYREQIKESVERVNTATQGLHPVCDVGGNVGGCLRASDALVDATQRAVDDLNGLDTPSTMSGEEMDLVSSLMRVGEAMEHRSAALRTNDDHGWRSAQAELLSASADYEQAVSEILDS